MWRDLRHAARALARSPVFTIAATLAIGLAIGANATIFGLVDGLWFRPPGVRDPSSLVWLFANTPTDRSGGWSFPDFVALSDRSRSFESVVALGRRGATMAGADGTPELLLVNIVSTNFFSALGVQPAAGRLFAAGDESALEREPGIVLGHEFWKRRFGADPTVVGRTIRLGREDAVSVTVLGVLPPTFRDVRASLDRDLWLPPPTWARLSDRSEFERRDFRWFEVLAVRKPGVGIAAAQAEVTALAAALAADYPATNAGRGARVVSDRAFRLETGGPNALALLALVLLVVLITCVNVANLLLARAAGRARETAVRAALGAGRGRLVRELMTESFLLGGLGALAGLTLAVWLIRLLPAILVQPPGFRSFVLFQADGRLLAFTLATTLLTTVLFGIAPSLFSARADVAHLIKGGTAGLPGSGGRLVANSLVIAQVAVSLVLLSAAALLTRSFVETRRGDLGFSRKPLLAAWLPFGDVPAATLAEGVRQVEALPGVASVAVAIRAPLSLSGGGRAQQVALPGQPAAPDAPLPEIKFNAVSANYFTTIGTRIIRGRTFAPEEERGGERVAIVSERFARQLFGEADPVGALVRVGGGNGPEHRVVGVAQDAVINDIGEPVEPYFYLPFTRGRYGEATLIVAASADPAALASPIRAALAAVDPSLEPRRQNTIAEYIAYSSSRYQATAVLAGSLGLIGLVLTSLGVYGVVAYRTGRRTRELGIRVALGAAAGEVLRLVLREGARVGALGIAVGIPLALVCSQLISSLLFGVSPRDPAALVAAAVVLFGSVCAATFVPAWRATSVDPSVALRES